MKMLYNKVFKSYLLMVVSLTISEIIFKIVCGLPILDWSIIRIFLGLNIVSLLFAFIFSFTGRILSNVFTIIICFFFTIYSIVEAGFYKFFGTFVSFGSKSQLNAVTDYVGNFIGSFKWYFLLLFIPFVLVLAFYIFVEHKIHIMELNEEIDFSDKFDSDDRKILNAKRAKKEKKNALFAEKASAIIAIGLIIGFYYSTFQVEFMQNELQLKTNKELLANPDLPNIAVSQLGYVAYSLTDLKSVYFKSNIKIDNKYTSGYDKPDQAINDFTRKIDDTIWEKLIEDEKNNNYKTLSNYYISQPITNKNDYTGIFLNKNVIVIMAEGVNNIALNPSYYPNIYKLYSEGWSFENSYSPTNSCSTGNNELSALASVYTINNVCTANYYKNNTYPQGLFNLFNDKGYSTSSYHNYTDLYYNRSIIHPNLGSGHFYGVQELGIPYSNVYKEWPSDVELMKKVLNNIKNEDKFMTFITTVSTHMPYDVSSELGDLYLDTFNNTGYNISVKRYMSKLKVLDESIGVLLDGLEKQGKLDDTIIVLFSDHSPYGIDIKDLNKYFDYDITVNNEADRTPFIIYNSSMTATKFEQYTSYVNIAPTIANLFGLEYDPRLYAGYDLFSKDYDNRLIFADGSWQDKKAFYNATSGKISYYNPNEKYSIDEVKNINTMVRNKIEMSNLAIKTNYFSYLKNRSGEYVVSPISGEAELIEEDEEEK